VKKYIALAVVILLVTLLWFRACMNRETQATAHLVFNDSIPSITNNVKYHHTAVRIDSLYQYYQKKNGYNCCVLVAKDGEILLQKGYGYSDFKKKKYIDAHTSFQLASVSKPITATAILLLVQEGKIDLKDDVKKYISDFPYEGITIEQLLCHRSGLPNYMHFCDQYVKDKKSRLTNNSDIISILVKNKPKLQYKPNTHFMYSNTNYSLLASIVEIVSDKSFADFLHERIFTPLEMKDTYLVTEEVSNQDIAKAYTYGFAPISKDYLDGVLGDKGICSSVMDMYRFHLALENGLLLNKEILALAYEPRSFERKGDKNYGLGWRMKVPKDGMKIIYHNGWWKGYNNLFYRRLEDSTVVIVLSNKLNKAIYKIENVLKILDGNSNSFDSEEENGVTSARLPDNVKANP
jgi:CubicO group peptidase (beta-lactamase class C family)